MALTISASQLKTFSDCERQWGFQKVLRVPEPPRERDPRTFGDILHAALERYLLADDLGNDPETGQPVNLYPEGWQVSQPRFVKKGEQPSDPPRVDVDEALMIQQLVQKGIEKRVVRRLPGRVVEKRVHMRVLEKTDELPLVNLMGFVDVWYRDRIEDHKTSKSTRWLLGQKKLRKDPQMLIYARDCIETAKKNGEAVPSAVILRHNQFVKDAARTVRFTAVEVPRREIEAFWTSWVVPMAERMRRRLDHTDWSEFQTLQVTTSATNTAAARIVRSASAGRLLTATTRE